LASQVREAAVSANAAGSSVAGERLLARARDYVELGRDTLARAFLKAVVERFAATDSADEATQLLKQLDGKGGR
jgi:TolA-binding protein